MNSYQLGLEQFNAGSINRATDYFKQAITDDKHHFESHHMLGICLASSHNENDALPIFLRAAELDPNIPEVHNNLGQVYDELNNYDLAADSFQKALSLRSSYLAALVNYANCCYKYRQLDLALALFKNALALKNNSSLHHQCSIIYFEQGLWKDALASINRAIELTPSAELNYAKAMIHITLGELDQGRTCLTKIIEMGGDSDLAQYHLAQINNTQVPDKAPNNYVKNLFDGFSSHFETDLLQHLQYQAPRNISRKIKDYFSANQLIDILDLGCGTGLVGQELSANIKTLIGVDLSPKMLLVAESKKIYDKLVESDIQQYLSTHDIESSIKFDLICSLDVFVYIGNLKKIFQHAFNLLRDRGVFAFSVESTDEENYQLLKSGRYAHNHQYITRIAKESGFEIKAEGGVDLRLECGNPIKGAFFFLTKPL